MMQNSRLTYEQSGVDYSKIDPLKIMAQQAAREMAKNLLAAGFEEIEASRGESERLNGNSIWYNPIPRRYEGQASRSHNVIFLSTRLNS